MQQTSEQRLEELEAKVSALVTCCALLMQQVPTPKKIPLLCLADEMENDGPPLALTEAQLKAMGQTYRQVCGQAFFA
ncbi:hypothetical protein SRS16CHR_02575 [Variovorax sp. SRS16]|uniref:hypothetical protein n=1 Tax=Variovorax sp. SRS16 TaxID=282217 RepID=UPI0013190A24|nr:hypothetical protein [Variovorax sp. SRS16]VTU20102.1 hypothetical protein SRS16CHR_02575 [Variovorax sp. SRS16]